MILKIYIKFIYKFKYKILFDILTRKNINIRMKFTQMILATVKVHSHHFFDSIE